ncbi:MAG: hypothetical protein DRP01_01000 [Archaeoglobales archaeon]|nr:MAG: hypothetical protein DRP01_01000 [Archaeoglobales archaeon]
MSDPIEESIALTLTESVGEEITVVAMKSRKQSSLPYSRLPSGKIVLFEERDPFSYRIKPGDVVDCVIKIVKPSYIIVKPIRIRRR